MKSVQEKELEQTIGMEDLFVLGGFIEDALRKTIKEAWMAALPVIAPKMGAKPWEDHSLGRLCEIISGMIASYKPGPENEDLYHMLMDTAETYFANCRAEEAEEDEFEDETYLKMANSED